MYKHRTAVDILALSLSALLYIRICHGLLGNGPLNMATFAIGLLTVAAVNALKLLRLYVILYGQDLENQEVCLLYTKSALVSSVFPYMLGDLYRMYVLGTALGNLREGVIVALLDRFMDTVGLLAVVVLDLTVSDGWSQLSPLIVLLILFVITIWALIYVFPSISSFWNTYLLKRHGSRRTLMGLELLSRARQLYNNAASIIHGRGVMLIALSVVAWGVETGAVALTRLLQTGRFDGTYVVGYLTSIISGRTMPESARYTVLSVALLGIACIIMLTKQATGRESA